MTQDERLDYLLRYLLTERKEYADIQLPDGMAEKRHLLRSLMNVRPPVPASAEFLAVQDAYLQARLAERGVTRLQDMRSAQPGLYLWQGDITTLAVDAIVNAANSQMLGCFVPCHGCIDNAIHTYAGVQLRLECAHVMSAQKEEEPTGGAKSQKPITCPAIMCCTRLARSSMASSPKQTGNCWQAATVPVWNLRRNMACTAWPSAAFPQANFISRTNSPRRSPSRRSRIGKSKTQIRWR